MIVQSNCLRRTVVGRFDDSLLWGIVDVSKLQLSYYKHPL